MSKNFGSSKFALAASGIILTFVGIALGWLESSVWVASLGLCVGLYGAANVVEKRNGS